MKKLSVFLAGLFLLMSSLSLRAQTAPTDYFAGKWKVMLEGTPGGDQNMFINLERKDGKLLGGTYDEKTGKETLKFSKVEEKEKSVTVYFTAQGVDVYLLLEKKDADNLTGNMLDMFDAKGLRVKAK